MSAATSPKNGLLLDQQQVIVAKKNNFNGIPNDGSADHGGYTERGAARNNGVGARERRNDRLNQSLNASQFQEAAMLQLATPHSGYNPITNPLPLTNQNPYIRKGNRVDVVDPRIGKQNMLANWSHHQQV